jgi:uncharacterized protein YukE
MYGADVAQLRATAAQFGAAAGRLDSQRMEISAAIGQSPWHGPDATHFGQAWHGSLSGAMARAASALADAAQTLRNNADAQDQASAVVGGAHSGLPFPGLTPSVGGDPSWVDKLLPGLHWPPGVDHWQRPDFTWPFWLHPSGPLLGDPGMDIGNRDEGPLGGDPGMDIGHPDDGPIHAVNNALNQPILGSGLTFGDGIGLIPKVGDATDAISAADKICHGQIPWHEGADALGGMMRSDAKNGLMYGIGANISLWSDVIDLGTKPVADGGIDWSWKGMQDAWNGAMTLDGWQQVGKDLTEKLPAILIGDLKFW